ncbi:hypothetical protein LOZ65_001701 [Ophidiomyces ophidiicola]|nr:hypothetical protein LOZ65_001701 [Ophidiomyces ophidiicola]
MPARPISLSARSRCLLRSQQHAQRQAFSTRSALCGAHEPHYDPPTGWLFGVKPGHKYVKEGWEGLWTYGFVGSLVVAGIAYAFKPDTSYVLPLNLRLSVLALGGTLTLISTLLIWFLFFFSLSQMLIDSFPLRIQTWALEEARRRLEQEGILEDPDTVQKK